MSAKHTAAEVQAFDTLIELIKKETSALSESEVEQLADSLGNVLLDLCNHAYSRPFEDMGDFVYPYTPGDNP